LKGLNHAKINSCKLARTGGLNCPNGALSNAWNANAADAQVKIANFTFEPPVLTVKVGTTVTWVNDDDIPHLVSEKDGKFRSSALDTNETFSETFKDAGTIEYFCVLHPHMTGKIVVEP